MIEDYGRKLGVITDYSNTSLQKFNIMNIELKRLWATVFGYSEFDAKVGKLGGMVVKTN
jgi:hypothetical protein